MDSQVGADFDRWVDQTAYLLRERRWQEVDVVTLIEEIEALGKRERRGIVSPLIRLLLHLLKWQYQAQRRSDSWLDSITDARTQIDLALQDSPSLKLYPAEVLAESYQRARRQAAQQTGLDPLRFPETCPYDLARVLQEDWLPEATE